MYFRVASPESILVIPTIIERMCRNEKQVSFPAKDEEKNSMAMSNREKKLSFSNFPFVKVNRPTLYKIQKTIFDFEG